jgi:hypothetical protein
VTFDYRLYDYFVGCSVALLSESFQCRFGSGVRISRPVKTDETKVTDINKYRTTHKQNSFLKLTGNALTFPRN